MGSSEEELREYLNKILVEINIRSERLRSLDEQKKQFLTLARSGQLRYPPLSRVSDLVRTSANRRERAEKIRDLNILFHEAKRELEVAQVRKSEAEQDLLDLGSIKGEGE